MNQIFGGSLKHTFYGKTRKKQSHKRRKIPQERREGEEWQPAIWDPPEREAPVFGI